MGLIIAAIVFLVIGIILMINLYQKNKDLEEGLGNAQDKIKALEDELEQKKIENLRFALNPHSFRNTLNTIEHLAKNTYESVHSLSGIFDYMLYDATNQFVPLGQEIKFAEEYLKLYKLRLKPTVNVKFNVDEKITGGVLESKTIAPLIFAHFIENAFKHGDLDSEDAFITIKIELLNEGELIYSVRNLVSHNTTNNKGGLGKNTFEERLQLLYKEKHHLEYQEENNVFTANLKLTLYEK